MDLKEKAVEFILDSCVSGIFCYYELADDCPINESDDLQANITNWLLGESLEDLFNVIAGRLEEYLEEGGTTENEDYIKGIKLLEEYENYEE